tara:strand:+ start:92 stop:466 length:375 start_codon:yes stop_codon:yes gene_type:complete
MAYYDDDVTAGLDYRRDEIKKYLNDRIKELKEYSKDEYNTLVKDGELHNEIFNTDYYIIGTYEAKQWLGDQAFDIIGIIKEYEEDNFGEVTTELDNPERVVNMYVYIVGEDLINEDPRFERGLP